MNSKEIISTLIKAGWQVVKKRGKGSHSVMTHPDYKSRPVTVPQGEVKNGTVRSIEKATGVKLLK